MKTSQAGIDLIKEYEGCRLETYRDSVGVKTIGYGHTDKVALGQKITQEEAEQFLREDLAKFERCVLSVIRVDIAQRQFDALVSFAFNLGCGALRRSTLARKLNRGDYDGAAREFGRWVKAGGRTLNGLVRRRAAEADLFNSSESYLSDDEGLLE